MEHSNLILKVVEMMKDINMLVVGAALDEIVQIEHLLAATLAHVAARAEEERADRAGTDDEKCVTMKDAANRTGIHEYTLREAGRNGTLPTVTLGRRHVYVRMSSLKEWIVKHERRRRQSGG